MITVVIPTVQDYGGVIPNKAIQTDPKDFANAVYPFHLYYNENWIPDVNAMASTTLTWATQANALALEMNGYANSAGASATNALDSATASANSATASANSAVDASNTAQSIGNTAYTLSQIGITFATLQNGDLIITYQSPITNVSFNANNELIIEY